MTTSRSELRHILRFLAPYKARIAAALVALVVAAGAVLVLGQGLRFVIDAGFGNGSQRQLNLALIGMVSIAAVMAVASYTRFYLMMSTGERVITDIRRAVFSHILTLSPSFYEGTRTGEIISRLTNDVTLVQSVIGSGFSMFLRNALMMIGAMILLIVTSPKLAALIVIGVPLTLVPILVLGKRVRRMSRHTQDRIADVSAYIDEAVHEVRTVQAYAHEDIDRLHFGERAEAAYESAVARIRDRGLLFSSVLLIAFCAIGV
ncbi:MAG TPA: ABC transporter transmembrane domain-containing protein, partial [Burkholderiales bacterium]